MVEIVPVGKTPTFAELARHAPILKGELPEGITVIRDDRTAQVFFSTIELDPFGFVIVERVLEAVEERLGCDLTGTKWGYELAVREETT